MFHRWRRPIVFALALLALGCFVGEKAVALSVDDGDAPPAQEGLQIAAAHALESSPAVERPTFLRNVLAGIAWGPTLERPRDSAISPTVRVILELDGMLIAVVLLDKYLPYQESLRVP